MQRAIGVLSILLFAMAGEGFAETAPTGQERGRVLLERACSGCHAIGREGISPHAEAPAFRLLGRRYPVESLEEALGEGLVSGHPEMPEFQFQPDEVGAIIAYLKSIQVPK